MDDFPVYPTHKAIENLEKFRRHLLEDILDAERLPRSVNKFVLFNALPHGKDHSTDFLLGQFEILAAEGRVELDTLGEYVVRLTGKGRKSLEKPEEDFQSRSQPIAHTTNSFTLNHSPVSGNVSQVSGSHVSVTQHVGVKDLQGIYAEIDAMVEAVRKSGEMSSQKKEDVEADAQQLKSELGKHLPSISRIKDYLGVFSALNAAASYVPNLALVISHFLKGLGLPVSD